LSGKLHGAAYRELICILATVRTVNITRFYTNFSLLLPAFHACCVTYHSTLHLSSSLDPSIQHFVLKHLQLFRWSERPTSTRTKVTG
jgi:hypothetical protein